MLYINCGIPIDSLTAFFLSLFELFELRQFCSLLVLRENLIITFVCIASQSWNFVLEIVFPVTRFHFHFPMFVFPLKLPVYKVSQNDFSINFLILLWKKSLVGKKYKKKSLLKGSIRIAQGRAADFFTWGGNFFLPPQVNSLPPHLVLHFNKGGKKFTWGGKEIMID